MKHKFITIGEIMLRLTPPDYEKIRTATSFEARYGGSEANVALSLANLGVDASFFTVVPGNSLGKSAVRMMRSNDVNCDSVIYSTEEETPAHRLGTYYLETGYGIRPSKVVYDRKHSAFSEYDFSKTDVKKLLEGYTWLHLSGITPALGKSCSELILTCLKTAKANGMTVSFDGAPAERVRAIIMAIQLGPTYGSGYRICPDADPCDGMLDVCYACGPVPRAVALPMFLSAKDGHHTKLPPVRMRRCRHAKLTFEEPDYPIQADGEPIVASRIEVDILAGVLHVWHPTR